MKNHILSAISRILLTGIFIGLLLLSQSTAAREKTTDVIIVGSGLSGLTAAYQLQKAGKRVLILEMSPHIGGRIRTATYVENAYAEVGLEEFWESNPALAILKELHVPMENSYSSFSSFFYQGKFYPFNVDTNTQFLQSFLNPEEMKAYQDWDRRMQAFYQQIDIRPLPEHLLALKELSFAEWIKNTSGLSAKIQEFVRIETEPEYATSWEKISALDGIAEWHIFSGIGMTPRHVVGGNQRAALAIADAIGKKHIHLNQLVTHIKSTETGIDVTASDQSNYRQQVFHAKYVITAIPLFRLNDIQFTPTLSKERKQAIQTQSGGAYFTAHILLDNKARNFWLHNQKSVLPVITDGPLGVIYEGHSAANQDVLLNLLITGSYAERFNSRISTPADIQQTLLDAIDKQWSGIKPSVKQMTFYRYHPQAIAAWPVGRSRFDELSDSLRRPQGRVYIAGDFTEDTHSNGAASSALRVVKSLLQTK